LNLLVKKIKPFLIVLFLLLSYLHAADINSTLVTANTQLYSNLLKKLRQSGAQDDQILLQEALLQKLISFPVAAPQKQQTFFLPKNRKEAKDLFIRWLDLLDKKSGLAQQQKSFRDKMATLQKQIRSIARTDQSLLTYQLQYALYIKNERDIQKETNAILKQLSEIESLLFQAPKALILNQNKLTNEHQKIFKERSLEEEKLKTLQIKKERLELLGNSSELVSFAKVYTAEKQHFKTIIMKQLSDEFLIFCDMLQKKDQSAFKWERTIVEHNENKDREKAIDALLEKMERKYLGVIYTLGGSTLQQAEDTAQSAWTMLSEPLFSISETPISILKLITVLAIIILGFVVGGLLKRSIMGRKDGDSEGDSDPHLSSKMLLSNIGYYFVLLVAFFIALKAVGVSLSSLAVVAGALSVGIGFGLQNIVSNFVSGLILMFEHSIKIGDYIQLDETLRGRVTDIRMRSTTIKTNANIDVIIPNQNFIKNNVVNWTMEDNLMRFEIPFGVKYGTNPQQVIDVILKSVKESGFTDVYTSRTRFTRVLMTEMADSSINFNLFVWVKGKEILHPKRTMSRFLILIYNALNAHNIEIPFPQRDLHVRSIEAGLHISTDNPSTQTTNEEKQ